MAKILREQKMNSNFEQSLAFVLKEEGGFVNDPHDPGGATNMGVTLNTWESWTGENVSVDDMKNLTVSDVAPVYKKNYWDAIKGDSLPIGIDYCLFDYAVNSGTHKACMAVQDCVDVASDGILGAISMAAISAMNPIDLINKISDNRLAFLRRLSTWQYYGTGWTNRVEFVRKNSIKMAS